MPFNVDLLNDGTAADARQRAFIRWCREVDDRDTKYIEQCVKYLDPKGYLHDHPAVSDSFVAELPEDFYKEYPNAFACVSVDELEKAYEECKAVEACKDNHNRASASIGKYRKFLQASGGLEQMATDLNTYTRGTFLSDVFVDEVFVDRALSLLGRKKNLILQGAPGTGKTYAAKRLAYCLMGERDDSRIQMVQFHQSMSYEDFVGGLRPNEEGGFKRELGTFGSFCAKAAEDPDHPYVFIIDEINRGNVSKIFGEMLMMVEVGHREETVVVPSVGQELCVPANLYIIGMMNTADRSIALIDIALRRRFAFMTMEPALDHPLFVEAVNQSGVAGLPKLVAAVKTLNDHIASDDRLGSGFCIGHSFLMPPANPEPDFCQEVVECELNPLIEEYWFDDPTKAAAEKKALEDALG